MFDKNINTISITIKKADDDYKKNNDETFTRNRQKEQSPALTGGNQSSRTVREDEEINRNAVSGPFAQSAVQGAIRYASPALILSGQTQMRPLKTGSPLANPSNYINQSIQSLNQEKSNSTQSV